MAKSPGRGGFRKGAGRKPANPEGKTMMVAVSVPIVLVDQLDTLAESKGWNRSEAVTNAIRKLLGAKASPKKRATD